MKKFHIFNPISFGTLILVVILAYGFLLPVDLKNTIKHTAIGKLFTPSKNSIKKVFNIVHLPYWLGKTDLPVLYINISRENEGELIDAIPFDQETFSYKKMLGEDKTYVNADFASPADGYEERVKIRFKGSSPNHWNAGKKSYRIKFKDNLFQGMSGLDLIIPEDRYYFTEVLSSYRAKKLGLLTREFKFVRGVINGVDRGVYLAVEPWSKEFLARNLMIDTNNILSKKDIEEEDVSFFKKEMIPNWKSYINEDVAHFDELATLLTLLEDADDKEFKLKIGSLVDLEKFYRWQLVLALAGSSHVGDSSNFVLMFNQITGKFEFLPFDINIGPAYSYDFTLTLAKRILSDEQILKEYKKVVSDYVSDDDNLKDDLAFYDGLYQKYFKEFYKDQLKLDPDYVFDRKVKQHRTWLVDNFHMLKDLTAGLSPSDFTPKETGYSKNAVVFDGSFKYFNDIFVSIDVFIIKNSQFLKKDWKTIVLPSGTHVFNQSVIIPKGLRLVIEPGATILLGPKISIISYSPVSAVANASSPITIAGYSSQPWGSFGVINTGEEKNYFVFVHVSGGSAWGGSTTELLNGVPFISQFSLRNTNSEVYNSIFENGHTDDAFHAIWGSVVIRYSIFRDTHSDALDLDMVRDSIVSGNRFYNYNPDSSGNDGDGLDISGTDNLEIFNNQISNFGDKCISIGEKAEAVIKNNILAGCNYGLAVKDDSRAVIDNNIIVGNKTAGVALYRKKQEFIKGGSAEIINSILWGNAREITIDETSEYSTKSGEWKQIEEQGISSLSVKDSTIEGGFRGENIKTDRPDFYRILPASIARYLKL
ncbi:MAG: CotH kinase family protein [bacterium]|nr:CotH kinase family protein [bacterium]